MRVVERPQDLIIDDVYVDLKPIFGKRIFLKCEGFNFAGSVKLKAATEMVEAAERDGRLRPGDTLVESSSGNLGAALAVVAADRGYSFICVTDPRSNPVTRKIVQALGGRVTVVTDEDGSGGYLGSRIQYVRGLCQQNAGYVWLNQYTNDDNWRAHYRYTAPSILDHFPAVTHLFVGAGTTGTLMGCARYLRDQGHPAQVVAVDSVGSVTFDGPAGPRYVPGLGTSRRPAILDNSFVDEVVMVDEAKTIAECRMLARRGYLVGGSTGTVVSAVRSRWHTFSHTDTIVAIAPDLGERYLNTVYDDGWTAATIDRQLVGAATGAPTAKGSR